MIEQNTPFQPDYVREASELGLPPGEWPIRIDFMDAYWARRSVVADAEGELQSVVYVNGDKTLEVFND